MLCSAMCRLIWMQLYNPLNLHSFISSSFRLLHILIRNMIMIYPHKVTITRVKKVVPTQVSDIKEKRNLVSLIRTSDHSETVNATAERSTN